MMRQIAGSFAQYEKARLVRKLREARERSGKLGGRKSMLRSGPSVALAKELRRQGKSWAQISAALFAESHTTARGKPYARSAVRAAAHRRSFLSQAGPARRPWRPSQKRERLKQNPASKA
jgi:hypothetical protein